VRTLGARDRLAMKNLLACFACVVVAACSSSSGTASDPGAKNPPASSSGDVPPVAPGSPTGDETWADGKELAAIDIPAGVTVTIAPGASLSAGVGAKIVVHGTLAVKSEGAHAKIDGASWKGIVVASGGMLAADGLDLSGADVAIEVDGGGTATFDHGNISGTPFAVAKGGKLSTSHANVTAPENATTVEGAFTASYLDYDEKDTHAIIADDPSATVFIEDSTFHSTGHLGATAGPDLLTANAAASFHVAYSDISGAHCGFHFEGGPIAKVEIDHVTVHQVTNGADLWGLAKPGTHTITNSNFAPTLAVAFDESGTNGTITVTGCYTPGKNNLASPSAVTIASPVTSAIADAHPR
jgi:hypothetical protein